MPTQPSREPATAAFKDMIGLWLLALGLIVELFAIVDFVTDWSPDSQPRMLVLGVLVVVLSLHVLFAKAKITTYSVVQAGDETRTISKYPQIWRGVAALSLVASVFFGGYAVYANWHMPQPPHDHLRLAVAQLQSSSGSRDLAYDTVQLIRERILDHKRGGASIDVVMLGGDVVDSVDRACAYGRKVGAHLVLWGSVTKLLGGNAEINCRLTPTGRSLREYLPKSLHRRFTVQGSFPAAAGTQAGNTITVAPDVGLPGRTLVFLEDEMRTVQETANTVLLCAGLARLGQGPSQDVIKARELLDMVPQDPLTVYAAARFHSGVSCLPIENDEGQGQLASMVMGGPDVDGEMWEIASARFREAYSAAEAATKQPLTRGAAASMKDLRLWAHINRGVALWALGKCKEAITESRKAIALESNATVHNNLGCILMIEKKLAEAVTEFRKSINLDGDRAGSHNNLGQALQLKGELGQAIGEYRRAIAIDPRYASAHANLGEVLACQGSVEEAMLELRAAIELDAGFASAHSSLGDLLGERAELSRAVTEYRMAIRADPGYMPAYVGLGVALAQQGKTEAAVEEYRRAIAIEPGLAVVHGKLALALSELGRAQESIRELRTTIRLEPKDPVAHFNLGVELAKQGKNEEAAEAWRRATQCDPKQTRDTWCPRIGAAEQQTRHDAIASAHADLGTALYNDGRFEDAMRELHVAIDMNPHLTACWYILGCCYARTESHHDAVMCWRQYLKLDPYGADAQRARYQIQQYSRDEEE